MPSPGHAACPSKTMAGRNGAPRVEGRSSLRFAEGSERMTDSRSDDLVRIAAVGDIHCAKSSPGTIQPLFAQIAERADVLLLCGDLTDYGLVEEAQILVKELP